MRKLVMLGMLGQISTAHADACQSLLCFAGELQNPIGKVGG